MMGLAQMLANPGGRGAGKGSASNFDGAERLSSDLEPNQLGCQRCPSGHLIRCACAGQTGLCVARLRCVESCPAVADARVILEGSDHR